MFNGSPDGKLQCQHSDAANHGLTSACSDLPPEAVDLATWSGNHGPGLSPAMVNLNQSHQLTDGGVA